ncbi:MAG: hypothetical protein MK538_11915, partial [Planctomycetes bacterium]|nr:hypothetical protein [Planctomycetota bacterium]
RAYEIGLPMEPPLPSRVDKVQQMVARAADMMISANEQLYDFNYAQKYLAEEVASSIVDYVLARRTDQFNNRIHLVSELLTLDEVTDELFYGPQPVIPDGEEIYAGDFLVRRDEFGDLVPVLDEDLDAALERQEMMDGLLDEFGAFGDLPPEFGMDRLASSGMTRGMADWPTGEDEEGREIILEPPKAVGLRDLFTTYSTGKINLNTASVPVLYGLLLSLEDDEAQDVALNIADYRNRFKDEGGEGEDGDAPRTVGQEADGTTPSTRELAEEAAAMAGIDSGELEGMMGQLGSTYQDINTNYFTSLEQIEMVDGTEGGADDLLRRDEGVERVDVEGDTLFRRVMHDYQKVAVFGSSHFEVAMKAKREKSRSVKHGKLVVRRDIQRRMIEILMWREGAR